MKIKSMLLLGGLVLMCASLAFATPASSCVGDFGAGTGVCTIYEGTNGEVQDFNLGSPNIGTGLVDIVDPDGSLSDSLDFYFASDGNVHLLFQSDQFAQGGGFIGSTEDALGNWCYLCGFGNNVYMGVSPEAVPEPSSLLLLGSGIVGLAGVIRRRLS